MGRRWFGLGDKLAQAEAGWTRRIRGKHSGGQIEPERERKRGEQEGEDVIFPHVEQMVQFCGKEQFPQCRAQRSGGERQQLNIFIFTPGPQVRSRSSGLPRGYDPGSYVSTFVMTS